MSFDEQPDGDPHGECAIEIHRLQEELAAERAAREKAESECAALRESVIPLLKDVLGMHSDKESSQYNECEIDPCMWCVAAQKVVDAARSVEKGGEHG